MGNRKRTPKPAETPKDTTEEVSLQDKIEADLVTGNVSGVRVVESSDAPVLGADFFAQHEETEYVLAEALLRNANLEYQEYQVYVRLGVESSDEIVIREELDRLFPVPDAIKQNRRSRKRSRKSTQQERDWADKRVDARMRLILTRFFYEVPPEDAPPDFEPVPLLTWDTESAVGSDVRMLNKATVEELYRVWRRINPDAIPEDELARFQDI